jgi:nucleoside-diphosphate-sugar epimerase
MNASNISTRASTMASAGGQMSVRRLLAESPILLTGATGYLGSVVLESLLRRGGSSTVYVLARGRRGKSAEHRVRR